MSWLRDVLGASVSVPRLPRSHTEAHKSAWLQAISAVSVVSVDFGKVKIWLTEKIDSVQSVHVL